ncbi:hypothetical protein HKX48_004483 [Thoreauomyces humboldtii]|nr:hypothetical protein HKX48_004483 [Thoreauomyces humboldtii]
MPTTPTESESASNVSGLPEYPVDNIEPGNESTFSFSRPVTTRPAVTNRESVAYNDIFPSRRTMDSENQRPRKALGSVRRQNTMSRPERQRSTRRPLMRSPSAAPPAARAGATTTAGPPARLTEVTPAKAQFADDQPGSASVIWTWASRIMTCCFISPCLSACGKRDRAVQQAWREKVALCMIIAVMCACVVFITVGIQKVLCPDKSDAITVAMFDSPNETFNPSNDGVFIDGYQYDFAGVQTNLAARGFTIGDDRRGTDLSLLFVTRSTACASYYPAGTNCDFPSVAGISPTSQCASTSWLSGVVSAKRYLDWDELPLHTTAPHMLTVYSGAVLNLTTYLSSPESAANPTLTPLLTSNLGKDGTYRYIRTSAGQTGVECLSQGYRVGWVGAERNGCIAAQVLQVVALIIILGVVMAKFFMAVWFHWFGLPKSRLLSATTTVAEKRMSRSSARYSTAGGNPRHSVLGYFAPQTKDLHTIMLVTCYSEGRDGIKSTLDSLASTDYPDSKKLLFVVADGIITGHGEEMSTPDIITGMMELDDNQRNPEAKSYIAIAHGERQHNMAKVYAGFYVVGNRRVPMITVVKCGTPGEASTAKPGNRGKRDSQLIIMNFLSRTLFNDRMTALDHELFTRIHAVATTADKYECILMVDADTKVAPESLKHMVGAMRSDPTIMGLCGETRIANKTASMTSAIQVFEYYISHHLGKAFESVFGGVTCLPGCFCMYRIKCPKGGDTGSTVPILTNPDIVEEYSENVVDTLHKKNLLLLGEDRFLTTLMLRNFPHRKMVFVPQAVCWTIVPDQFKVLLSQRRRWINSTVHNLMELVLVRDLCGTFCFSMQFVIMLELIGTVVLPAAICLTLYLIISAIVNQSADLIPFLMLGAILGLPGVLIAITTRKLVYVLWMIVYLFSLPIWNFVLPVYAYWHFDDFSWGETRKVEGEIREESHGGKAGTFESRAVQMKKWAEWEKDKSGRPKSAHDRRSVYENQRKSMHSIPFGAPVGPGINGGDYGKRKSSVPSLPHGVSFKPTHQHSQSNEYWPQPTANARDSYFPPLLMGGLPRTGGVQYPPSVISTNGPGSANQANGPNSAQLPSPGPYSAMDVGPFSAGPSTSQSSLASAAERPYGYTSRPQPPLPPNVRYEAQDRRPVPVHDEQHVTYEMTPRGPPSTDTPSELRPR